MVIAFLLDLDTERDTVFAVTIFQIGPIGRRAVNFCNKVELGNSFIPLGALPEFGLRITIFMNMILGR